MTLTCWFFVFPQHLSLYFPISSFSYTWFQGDNINKIIKVWFIFFQKISCISWWYNLHSRCTQKPISNISIIGTNCLLEWRIEVFMIRSLFRASGLVKQILGHRTGVNGWRSTVCMRCRTTWLFFPFSFKAMNLSSLLFTSSLILKLPDCEMFFHHFKSL